MTLEECLGTCKSCPSCKPEPYQGPVPCTLDGKDIIWHGLNRQCAQEKLSGDVDIALMETMKRQAAGGCSDCGGKVDAAKIKSSPAAQEAFLRGEE